MKQLTLLSIFALSILSFHNVDVSSFRLPASEEAEVEVEVEVEVEKSQEEVICENENKISSLEKELESLEEKRLELEDLLDKALAKKDEQEGKEKKKKKKVSAADLQNYMTSMLMYRMYSMQSAPTISYLDSPLYKSSSSQLVSYLNAVQTNQSILDNQHAGTWTPSFTPNGDLVDYQYGPAGVFSNQVIEHAYRPLNTLESINRGNAPLGSFAF